MIRLVILALLGLVAGTRASSPPPEFLVREWRSDEGLPGNFVRSVGQSADGFLWVATAEGVARFDGISFRTVVTLGSRLGRPIDLFRLFTPADGSVWVATSREGLYRVGLDGLKEVVADYAGEDSGLITRLLVHDGEACFLRNGGWWRVAPDGPVRIETIDAGLAEAIQLSASVASRRGRLDGPERPTRLIDQQGGIWSFSEGILEYRESAGAESVRVREFDEAITASDLLEDREGNLWIASRAQGLVQVRISRVRHVSVGEDYYSSSTLACLREPDGSWWIAPRSGGLDRVRDGELSHVPIVTSEVRTVSCMHLDRSGELWVATRGGSVFVYDRESGTVVSRFDRGPRISQVSAIVEDREGRLWFAGRRGIFRANGSGVEDFSQAKGVEQGEFTTLALDEEGVLFAGTGDGRVLRFDGEGFSQLDGPGSEQLRWISGIVPMPGGEVWVSTLGMGLHQWKDGRWRGFGDESGLPDERLTGLVLESGGFFWMGSLGGIIRVAREDLIRHLEDIDFAIPWVNLDRSDGMLTRECSGAAQPGIFEDSDGALWFPTTRGISGIHPGKMRINRVPPDIQFRSVEVDGVPQPLDRGTIEVGPGRVRLAFRYAGVSLTSPEKVTYRVQLKGLDVHPLLVGGERRVDYQAVPPGRYTLQVTATNGDGISTPEPATVPILIRPHFWETPWFIGTISLSLLLLAIAAGWLVARRRMRRRFEALRVRSALQSERSRISRDLHDDLGASLTSVSILSSLASEKNRDAELDSSLTRLSQKAKQVVGALDEIVWATNPSQDSLRSLVEYLAFSAREFLKTVDVPLQTEILRDVPEVQIGPRRRHNVALAVRESINNAVKHAEPGSIRLSIGIEDENLVVRVVDDGLGFEVDQAGPGNGLVNLRQRMEECGGDFQVDSQPGAGSTVTITLPIPSENP